MQDPACCRAVARAGLMPGVYRSSRHPVHWTH